MSTKYTKAADLVERHMQYCFGEFDEFGQQIFEGDVRMLCHMAGISATDVDERYQQFGAYLMEARQRNLADLPINQLDVVRLNVLGGAGEDMMNKFFGQDIEKMNAAIKAGETLDLSATETRDEIIERVLADTSAVIAPIADWLAENENFRKGHFMALEEYIFSFINQGSSYHLVDFPTAETLCNRINEALEAHGFESLPDEMAGPRHNVDGANHLRAIPGGKKPELKM